MAVSIRLSRGGAKKRPYYKIVIADARTARGGKFIERIGSYNPQLPKDSPERVKLDADRARHWLSVGAQPSDRVARFLDAAGVRERAARNNPNKGALGDKAKEGATREAENAAFAESDSSEDWAGHESFSVNVYIDHDDEEAVQQLAESARNFMQFLGYSAQTELMSA